MTSTMDLYQRLLEHFGPQKWWPAETRFEMMVGAILTQNVNWNNVETAIDNLKKEGCLTPMSIWEIEKAHLEELIRPTGFYRQKAARLKRLSRCVLENGGVDHFLRQENLRDALLEIKGIGPETADSIALYAGDRPIFVVDAYTMRIVKRAFGFEGSYDDVQGYFQNTVPTDIEIYKEFHALLVRLGKENCSKRSPVCDGCPVNPLCLLRKPSASIF